ncbi:response regulator [Candidatus Venteria ishoeyi]|uniref:histidine kinase n=1 Tax=Candidatus Venteria ishoeyi TaxID=1899563 RepID=A0A1H6F5Q6_9GAMM|nr:response regulator [Candidatus Venteria ishoeyi]SEH04406.1 Autoinducer 2 sensor kinase/phosphatase LuxQ [Candidatus Venteria ishoeyi]
MNKLWDFWTASIRRQLVLGVALVHALLMMLFIVDLVERQRGFLHQQSQQQALSLSSTLAANSLSWVLASDFIGLEEVVHALSGYPDLRYAMILDPQGKVLGHSQRTLAGKFVVDDISLSFLEKKPSVQILVNTARIIDVAAPILRDTQLVGWARISLGQEQSSQGLQAVSREGVLYALIAILTGTLFAYFMARGLTRGLYHLLDVAESTRAGKRDLRANTSRHDELGLLAQGFNRMLEALNTRERELHQLNQTLEQRVEQRTEELEKNRKRMEIALDAAEAGTFYWDISTNKVVWDKRSKKIFGIQDFDGTYATWASFVLVADLKACEQHLKAVLQDPDTEGLNLSYRIRRPDKIIRHINVSALIDRNADGSARLITGLHQDVTRQKYHEAELEQARQTAEQANQAKSRFLANMSHELRTPLNAILGFSQLMARSHDATNTQRTQLEVINHSGEHLLEMINDVLDLSKIEAGCVELEPEVFDLPRLLEDIGQMFTMRTESAGLRFALTLEPTLAHYVKADNGKLRQILINLLGNAVKFTREGGIALRARTLPETDDPDICLLQLEVQDSGSGILPEQQQQIFEPFIQAHRGDSDTKGTGLGLAISKSFIALMGGKIRLESQPGHGALFCVELPVTLADTTEVDTITEYHKSMVEGLEPGQTAWRILVVEDIVENRLLLTTLLREVGFNVREAQNGQEAVAQFQAWQPHFIWMDMRMPVMDGYEATRRIRTLQGGDSVKIAALTASAFKEQRIVILDAGCDDVVHKPFREQEIFATMAHYLGVVYRYEKVTEYTTPTSAAVAAPLSVEDFVQVSQATLESLQDACLDLNSDKIIEIAQNLQDLDMKLANRIQAMAEHYQYETLLALCEQVLADNHL